MVKTGMVQKPYDSDLSYAAYPADYNAYYKQAKPGSVYVEFEVPADSIKMAGNGWARIPCPGSPESRLNVKNGGEEIQYPPVSNINLKGEK